MKNKQTNKKQKTSKLNTIEVLISKALINSNITHDEFFSVNNVLKEYSNINKSLKT